MKLAVSSWSLRDHVNKDFPLKDFPRVVKERYGVEAVELCQMHFQAQDAKYLDEIINGLQATVGGYKHAHRYWKHISAG